MYYNKQRERGFPSQIQYLFIDFQKKNNVYNGLFVQNIGPDFEGVWFSHHGGRKLCYCK